MKKIIFAFVLLLLIPLNVQAYESNIMKNQEKNQEVEQLYDYMTNMKTKYEILNNVDIKTYVQDYIKSGDGKYSTKEISKALLSYGFREVVSCGKLMAMVIIICISAP
jgi:stage III sporulation protein AE